LLCLLFLGLMLKGGRLKIWIPRVWHSSVLSATALRKPTTHIQLNISLSLSLLLPTCQCKYGVPLSVAACWRMLSFTCII
jgi:hypothetical protein